MKKLTVPCVFYACLCVFSLVVGVLYIAGARELNPLELSDGFVSRIRDVRAFARMMGGVTFLVGVVQGLTALAIRKRRFYALPLGFTIFSIASVTVKLAGKINAFPLLKLVAYLVMLAILIADRREFGRQASRKPDALAGDGAQEEKRL